MLIKVLQYYLIENWLWIILKHIQIATKWYEISFQLRSQILPQAPSANTVSCAMMTVPIFVFQYLVDVVLVVCSETESAEFTFAFIVYTARGVWAFFAWLGIYNATGSLWQTWVEALIEVWKENLGVTCELLLTKWAEIVWINIKILHPGHKLVIVLWKGIYINSKLSCSIFLVLNFLFYKRLHRIFCSFDSLVLDLQVLFNCFH